MFVIFTVTSVKIDIGTTTSSVIVGTTKSNSDPTRWIGRTIIINRLNKVQGVTDTKMIVTKVSGVLASSTVDSITLVTITVPVTIPVLPLSNYGARAHILLF
jgi:hypothetical protein